MMRATLATLTLAVLWCDSAQAQTPVPETNTALLATDHYTRSHRWDLVHQRIAVSHFNWDSTSFDGDVTTTLVSREDGLDTLVLDEGHLLVNTRVRDRSGRALITTRSGDTLVVHLAHPINYGDTAVFTIVYRGRVDNGSGLTFITNDGLPHRPDQIWSQGESTDNHRWFPTYDAPNDKMTWELSATVPKADLAISNGRLVSNLVHGADRTMTWNQDRPSATYLVSLVVAPLAVTHDTWKGIPVDYYTYHSDSALAWRLFHVTPDMIDVYSRLTGIRYPWAKYAQTTVADFFGGMENVSATTLVDWLPGAHDYQDRPWYRYILIPHELAHQWFGDYVTTQDWANTWLNEGFAEFMPGQYWNEKLGGHAEEDYYADEYRQFLDIEAQRSMPLASMGSNNIYPKGALVLKMLKDYLGPTRFWAGIHTYLTTHAFGNGTSEDLRKAYLQATGLNLDWFWEEWVYDAGLPRFTVTAKWDSATARLNVAVRQTQADSFKTDSTGRLFQVPAAFRMPVTIHVGWNGGDRLFHGMLDTREQTFVIDSVSRAPNMVIFDDGNHVLKTLTFDEPSEWLAQELKRDPDLWDREWAIAQLARHPNDAVAAGALTEAATGADYSLTRVEAVDALAGFPASIAMGSLSGAVKDTSSAVRAAAATAMGRVNGSGAVATLRDLFAHDSSDQVRAAAIGALAEVDSSALHAIFARAMATPSYRDAIRDAALNGVLVAKDTSMIGAVDAAAATEEFPMHVLAVFAARGSTHAATLLAGHLDDHRPALRRWAFNAYQNTMVRVDRAATLAQLKAAVGGVRDPSTHQQVEALIARLQQP